MKKGILILLIVALLPAAVFAGRGMFDLTLGATGQFNKTIGEVKEMKAEDWKAIKFENFNVGAELKVKAAIVETGATGYFKKIGDQVLVAGLGYAGLSLDIFFVRIGLGVGYEYIFSEGKLYLGVGEKLIDQLKDAPMIIRASADFLIGPVTVGAFATMDTGVSINQKNWKDLVAVKDNFNAAKCGLSVGFALL